MTDRQHFEGAGVPGGIDREGASAPPGASDNQLPASGPASAAAVAAPLAGLVEEEERLEGGAKAVAALRLVLAVLAIAVTGALQAGGEGAGGALPGPKLFGWHPIYTVAVAACFVELAYLLLLRYARAVQRVALLVAAGLAVDILLGSALAYLTGGYTSAFLPLLFVWIIAAAAVLSARMAVAAASLAVVCLSVGLLMRHFGIHPGGQPGSVQPPAELWRAGAFHLGQSGALFIVAFLAGTVSRNMSATRLVADRVLAALQEGLIVLDRSLTVRFANREARRLLGAELPRGASLDEALAPDRLAQVRGMLAGRAGFGPALVAVDAPGRGEALTLAVSGTTVASTRGAFRGMIVVVSDRSAEVRLEEARRLAEQRRTVSELAMSIAHEIRNPLSAVRSAVQEIGREPRLSSGGRELVDVVVSESDRLDRIVTDFLAFARPRPPQLSAIGLAELTSEVLDTVARGLPNDRQVEMRNEVPRGEMLRADAAQMRQALLNLGLNAAAAVNGSGRVRVTTRREELGRFLARMSPARRERLIGLGGPSAAGRPGLVISVVDDGCGMDEATLARAGEPFFTTRPGGTGLGLAIVERFAAAHGGATYLASQPGRGTTVEIWLPDRAEVTADA